MPKQVTGGVIAQLNRKTGSEPVIVVGINWGATMSWYSSRALAGYNNNVLEIGAIRSQKRTDTMCSSSSTTVTFSDTDGVMKGILDSRNPEGAPAVVYLAFAGMSAGNFVELLRGKTAGPVEWDEGARTVSLSIESITEAHEVGYSATVQDFPDIMPEAEGVPWPMIFGSCAHVPCLQVREHVTGHLKFPIKLYKNPSYKNPPNTNTILLQEDPDVYSYNDDPPTLNTIYVEGGDRFPQTTEIRIEINDCIFRGIMKGEIFSVTEANAPRYTNIKFDARPSNDLDYQNNRVAWIKKIDFAGDEIIPSLVNHHIYLQAPSNKQWYNYVTRQIGNKIWLRYPVVSPITKKTVLLTGSNTITKCYCVTINGMSEDVAGLIQRLSEALAARRQVPGQTTFGRVIFTLVDYENQENAWWRASSDVEVHLWDQEDPDIYIASLIELQSIKAVYGKRKVQMPDGKSKDVIEQIPTLYYKKQLQSNYEVNGQFASALLFYRPLTSYAGQEWTGEIYVTATSTVGPNSARIIKWIFNEWTDLQPDSSFATIESKVQNHEAHFALFDKRDALRVAAEIAFQSRCGLILDSERVGIRFLAEQPVALNILSEGNTEFDSLRKTFTPTLEITTRLIASWTETYREKNRLNEVFQKNISKTERVIRSLVPSNRRRKTETRYSVYEENINKYGVRVRDESCYIYVNQNSVQAFLDFWGHRFANSWQLVSLRTTLMGTILQVFDGITLQYTDTNLLGSGLITGQIEEVTINPSNWSVELLIWMPRVAGSPVNDPQAWPD